MSKRPPGWRVYSNPDPQQTRFDPSVVVELLTTSHEAVAGVRWSSVVAYVSNGGE